MTPCVVSAATWFLPVAFFFAFFFFSLRLFSLLCYPKSDWIDFRFDYWHFYSSVLSLASITLYNKKWHFHDADDSFHSRFPISICSIIEICFFFRHSRSNSNSTSSPRNSPSQLSPPMAATAALRRSSDYGKNGFSKKFYRLLNFDMQF